MPIQISCPCGYSDQASDWSAARDTNCPRCGQMLRKMEVRQQVGSAALPGEQGFEMSIGPGSSQKTKPCPFCGEQILEAAIKCKHCGELFGAPGGAISTINVDAVLAEYQALKALRRRCNLLSFSLAVPGILCFVAQGFASGTLGRRGIQNDPVVIGLTVGLPVLGVILLAAAFVFAAKYKGRNGAWGLLCFLGCLGLLVVAILKDYNNERLTQLKAMLALMGQKV